MSKIKDLLAVEENIDDLKPVYDKKFYEFVQKSDKQRFAESILESCKGVAFEDWIAENAEFEHGDDDGEPCMFFENYLELCEECATGVFDGLIEQEHLDISDEYYSDVVKLATDLIADYYADYEDSLCADALVDWRNSHDEDNERRGIC